MGEKEISQLTAQAILADITLMIREDIRMDRSIMELAQALQDKTVKRRRDFHKYAEVAWTEFRTANLRDF